MSGKSAFIKYGGVAGVLGFVTGCTGLTLHSRVQSNFKNEVWVQNSLTLLKQHKAAVHLLGKPVKDFNLNLGDKEHNHTTNVESVFKIPVKGSKGHGYYFIRAEPGPEGKWEGVRCELQLDATTELEEEQFRDKRLVVFDKKRHGSPIPFDRLLE